MGKVIGIIVVILSSIAYALLLGLVKKEKKYKLIKLISKIVLPVLIICAAFLPYMFNSDVFTTVMRYIGVGACLLLTELFVVMTCKSKEENNLFKWIGLIIIVSFILSWIIPYGYFSSGTFYEYGMKRLGLTDIPTIMYNSIYFSLTTVLYLFVVGAFYGIFSKTKAYKALVSKFSKDISKHPILWTIIIICCLVMVASFTKSILVLVAFLPFLVSSLLNAKFDKVTTMGMTFGSALVGTVAATYGTEGLYWFNSYLSTEITTGLIYRLIIALIVIVFYVLYNVYRVKKHVLKNKNNEKIEDTFAVETVSGKVKSWPAIVILSILAVFVLLGYISWNTNFGIEIFNTFNEKLTEFGFGYDKAYTIFSYLLGGSTVAFGEMEITSLIAFMLLLSVIVAFMNKMSFNEFITSFAEGFKKMFKPVCLYALAYAVFLISYMSPYTATISDFGFTLTKSFNPYITTITSFITSIFHADLGYSSYLVGSVLTSTYAENLDIVHTIYVVTYGLVQVFVPTSGLLLVGLSYTKVDYKQWFKYIWLFVAVVTVVLIIVSTVATYII